jgi:hypothetical protein
MTTFNSGSENANMITPDQEPRFFEVQFGENSFQVWLERLAGLEILKALYTGAEEGSKRNRTGTQADYLQGWHVGSCNDRSERKGQKFNDTNDHLSTNKAYSEVSRGLIFAAEAQSKHSL